MVPPLPKRFQISALTPISTDHSLSSVTVLLATYQEGDDMITGLVKDMLALFCIFFYLSLSLVLSHDNFTLHEPEKAKGEADSQIKDLLYYHSMSAKWFGWLISELAALKFSVFFF
jgi:hypothetical protein